jgi:hypothetical protein
MGWKEADRWLGQQVIHWLELDAARRGQLSPRRASSGAADPQSGTLRRDRGMGYERA